MKEIEEEMRVACTGDAVLFTVEKTVESDKENILRMIH